jgi:hypothetical protein
MLHPDDEVRPGVEVGVAKIEAVAVRDTGDVIDLVGLEPAMAQAEARATAGIGHPAVVTGRVGERVQHIQIDGEHRGDFAESELRSGSKVEAWLEHRTKRGVSSDIDNLGVEADTPLNAHAETAGGTLRIPLSTLGGGGNVRLLRSRDRTALWWAVQLLREAWVRCEQNQRERDTGDDVSCHVDPPTSA